jgi:hypothetical protein
MIEAHAAEVARGQNTGSFPGDRLAGICMVAAPLLLTTAAALFIGISEGGARQQLAGFETNNTRALAAVNIAVAGVILTAFAVAGVAALVTRQRPGLGHAGGALTIVGLFGPAFFLGIDYVGIHLARLTDRNGAVAVFEKAAATPNVVNVAGPALVVGFVLLAAGTAKTGVLPLARSWALGATALAPIGLISGFVVITVVAWLALAVALVPLGVRLLQR